VDRDAWICDRCETAGCQLCNTPDFERNREALWDAESSSQSKGWITQENPEPTLKSCFPAILLVVGLVLAIVYLGFLIP